VPLVHLKFGADTDAVDDDQNTPIYIACGQGHTDLVDLLLKHGSNIHIASEWGTTCFMKAAESGKASILDVLIKHGADISVLDLDNESALTYNDSPEVLASLLHRGCTAGFPGAFTRARHDHLKSKSLLFNSGVDMLSAEASLIPNYSWQNFMFRCIWRLVQKGVWKYSLTELAAMQLHFSAVRGIPDRLPCVFDHCQRAGVEVQLWDVPLAAACSSGRLEAVKFLIRMGAKSNLPDWETMSEAFYQSRHHSNIQKWFLIGRFTEQRKIAATAHDEDREPVPWSGISTMELRLVGKYGWHAGSSLNYVSWVGQWNDQDLIDYCLAAIQEGV